MNYICRVVFKGLWSISFIFAAIIFSCNLMQALWQWNKIFWVADKSSSSYMAALLSYASLKKNNFPPLNNKECSVTGPAYGFLYLVSSIHSLWYVNNHSVIITLWLTLKRILQQSLLKLSLLLGCWWLL